MRVPSKSWTLPVAVFSATLALSACSSSGKGSTGGSTGASSGSSNSSSGGSAKIAVVLKGLDNAFFQTMEDGVKAAGASTGSTVQVQAATSITDTTGQADKLSVLATQDYSCFVVNPISGTNLIQGIAQLAGKKKTIVNIDSPVDSGAAKKANATLATYIGTNNVLAGTMAGKEMVKLLPSGGSVAVVGGIAGDVTSGARVSGFRAGIKAQPSIKFLTTVPGNWDRQEALTQATTLLRAHPDLGGFFVANDDMALGVARAIATAGKTGKVKVISVDGLKEAEQAVKSGQLSALIAQYPYAIGQMGVEACKAAIAGKTLPTNVAAPVQLVTKANAAKALAVTPNPFESFNDPFAALLK